MNEIYNITKKLVDCQKYLYEIEINNLKNTPIYSKTIYDINQLLKKEDEIYKNLNISLQEIDRIIIENINNLENAKDEFEASYYKRIISKLIDIQNNLKSEQMKNAFDSSILVNGTKIQDKIYNCLGTLYFKILDEFINDDKYASIKNELLKVKYNLSLVYDELEKNMVNNNFNVPSDIYNDIYFEGQLSNIPIKATAKLIDMELIKAIEHSTVELILPSRLKPSEIIIHTCLIRAAFSIMSNNGRHDYTNIVNSLLNDDKLPVKNDEEKYLLKCINDYNGDRTKVKTLYLGIKLN